MRSRLIMAIMIILWPDSARKKMRRNIFAQELAILITGNIINSYSKYDYNN